MKRIAILKKAVLFAVPMLAVCSVLTGCELEIQNSKGAITVQSSPDRAQILINGTPQGQTPASIAGLAAGEYLVELRKEGYERSYKSVSLLDGQELGGGGLDLQRGCLGGCACTRHEQQTGRSALLEHVEHRGTRPSQPTSEDGC